VVREAADLLSALKADAIVAIGGGSAIVTARAAAILFAEGHDVRAMSTQWADGRLVSPKLSAPKLPIWIVPSTPTTAYSKAGSAVRDPETGDRLALFDPKTRAQGVLLDPQAALSAPASLAKGAALNAMSMSIESIQGSRDPLADALLVQALTELARWLPHIDSTPQDGDLRLRLMVGALLSGQGSDFVGGGLAQALAHSAGPRSSVSNGIVESILLPHTMRFTAPATPGRLAVVAKAMAGTAVPWDANSESDDDLDARAITAVDELCAGLGVPRRLRDVDVERSDLDGIAEHTLNDWTLTRIPRRADREDLLAVLEAAW
jgi:alcohol dehydrogenase class IV